MKSLKLLILALGLFTVNVFANPVDPIKPTDELRIQIVDMIGNIYMDEMEEAEYGAHVLFTVNNKKELIVLSVDSDNSLLESSLKRRLNFKKVNHSPSKPGEIYLLPVKMVREL